MLKHPTCWVVDISVLMEILEPLLTQFSESRSWWLKSWIDHSLETQLLMSVTNKYPEADGELSVLRLNTYLFHHEAEMHFFELVRRTIGQYRGDCVTRLDYNHLYIFIYDG